ncbi:MAG: hypothetical protein Q7O66_08720 [Dehalococcoidia bacterium]|nr:hypothetical protein [Dehalococcoidia bacterium]
MTTATIKTTGSTVVQNDAQNPFERQGQQLSLFHLRCARTANGLSHYYMYGDIEPEETLL